MTVSASLDLFSDASEDFPEPIITEESNELPPDRTEPVTPTGKICPECGEEIVRAPGTRGRLPSVHPWCKQGKPRSSVSGTPRAVRVSKGEQLAAEQTEIVLAHLESRMNRAVVLLSFVDPYDALVLRINTPELLDNLRPILMRFDRVRAFAIGTDTGGSIFGLVVAILTTILPIAAHHGMIPSEKVRNILLNAPMAMLNLQRRVEENGGEGLTSDLVARVQEEVKKARERRMRQATEETIATSER